MDGLESFAENSEILRSLFSAWPAFHDAEVVEVSLWRGRVYPGEWDDRNELPEVTIKLRILEATQPGATGEGNDVLVTLRFSDASAIKVPSFDDMACITHISVTPVSRGAYTSGEPLKPRLDVSLHTGIGEGVGASFSCLRITVVEAVRCSNK